MYISSYIDIPMLMFSFMVGYETFRKDYVANSLLSRQFLLMVVSVALGLVVAVVNRNETGLSLPFFVGAIICCVWAVYLLFTRPAKLPQQPNLN